MSTTETVLERPQLAEGSLLDEIMAQTRIAPSEEGYDVAKKGVAAFIENLIGGNQLDEAVNKSLVDQMLVELDKKISAQMDEILHDEKYQQMESAWRGLKLFVDRTDFRENNKVDLLHVTKEELLEDFEFAPETTQSGLYKHVYSSGYGQFGGEPTGAIIGNFAFTPSTADMKLLQYMGALGAMAHAPFISSVGPQFFGIDSFEELPNIKDIKSTFESPKYTKWRALRESEDARYIGLTAPRFLLRVPYDPTENPIKSFNYSENVSQSHEHYLWGNTAFAFATRLTDSFAKYRWCPNIIGPQSGGAVEDLPVHVFESMGALQSKIPTEVLITDRKEFELAEEGFIALTMRKGSDNAAFFSANSIQKAKIFPNTKEGKEAETNYKLGTQLPYMMIINRLAHYVKVLQREQIGAWKERQDLERELNAWIKQFVADQENPPADVRSRRPLRAAKIEVMDVEGNPGWYQVSLAVRPHFKYMGANFELSLVGRLDQA
ncbi:type VI secretion system contractile sheath large subunit [Vibrio fluvialis]|jgi:type VI secretion system protein ImpC|uniref:type VI secretion system contractile sheath large subunit n=1 Tax=Vibrio fluvialis TaxID=676 RepID=UPI000405F3A7|nr:type VI secretion system contractile sheath large subunit [Vibrio fluvialis]EKO3376149.1 type VI secretion system contractile sheath large subunit [Vibrio fluvialis]EKO3435534.1 type VI secretion system contractile sheath large subunit [Vibrio fluvialis]EKO3482105.1 type VI secretion system contractile sheath large subunit [Vibrio fluvialis]EKO3984613.1 type VI secretion system contractile sheath large subunit [Vibrio fluvialis]ELE2163515.1 type VI secretion system contractile sheath large 